MGFYDEMAAMTTELLIEFGHDVSFAAAGTPDTTAGTIGAPGPARVARGATVSLSVAQRAGINLAADATRMICIDNQVVASTEDTVTDSDGAWQVVQVDPVKPQDLLVATFVHVRR